MGASLDPLRYGLRALDEMAREQASVAPPRAVHGELFSPHPVLRPAARDGAAFSLRLFGDSADDATALVLGGASSRSFSPVPARAAAFFEAHAAVLAAGADDALTVGFPLATFVQQGSARAAPLFSRGGARARWKTGGDAWKLLPGAREGVALALPDELVLDLAEDAPYSVHAGVWHALFGLDGAALGAIAAAGSAGLEALVRAATRALESGGDDVTPERPAGGPLTRDDLTSFADAAARAARSRGFRCHPHGLAMLPPRGDPTSGLRTDLSAILLEPLPPRGPLAVYLGAPGARARRQAVVTSGKVPPTPSQLEAARMFEGAEDIVAVCGPPGCGKTALLHHVAAQAVVACALGPLWTRAPSRSAAWPLVVTSTNNAAVDHALAPFLGGPGLSVGIRLGNRKSLAETAAAILTSAIEDLQRPGELSLPDARAAFETLAAPVRSFLRERADAHRARSAEVERRRVLEKRTARIEATLARADEAPAPAIGLADLKAAEHALREHATAAGRLVSIHLESRKGSVGKACNKWRRANEVRGPRIEAVLATLGIATPYGELDPARPREDCARQKAAMEAVLEVLVRAELALRKPALRDELAALRAEIGPMPAETVDPAPDPALYDAALAVREAWARTHRSELLPRLVAARDAARAEWGTRGKPLPQALRELACVFPIAGCTLLSMRASFPLERDIIDRLVVDEAAQCAPVYAVPAFARARRAMLTGDTAQLPPVYTLDPRVDERLARGLDAQAIAPFRMGAESASSAQAAAEPRSRNRITLTEHFRSQPEIVALASRWSGYVLDVRTPLRSMADTSSRLVGSVSVVPVHGAGARAPEGVVNDAEAEVAVRLVEALVADGVDPADIAVMTPFVGQSVRVERELQLRGLVARGGVLVSTVHRLQGGERRVVVFSVTATARHHLRWLGERPHLLHVATSRAQDHLVVLVNPAAAEQEPALAPLRELLDASA